MCSIYFILWKHSRIAGFSWIKFLWIKCSDLRIEGMLYIILIKLYLFTFRPIKKMATGMILASLAFAAAAIVELKIEVSAK